VSAETIARCGSQSIDADRADFTDQGQTGMTDQSGLVYRLSPSGRLDTLLSNGISPNGLVLSPDEKVRGHYWILMRQRSGWRFMSSPVQRSSQVLYVAQTRDNSVWRLPLHKDGTTSKVCKFCESSSVRDGAANITLKPRVFPAVHVASYSMYAFDAPC
jgi:sugar lactone lactonase YvrE